MGRSLNCVLGLVLLAGPALAQSEPRAGSSYGDRAPAAGRLHDALRLEPGQDGAWRAYQAAIAPDPQQAARRSQAQLLMPNLATPRRLALLRAQMQADLEAFDRGAEAVNAFYAGLTPAQQRIFDAETARRPDR